MSRLDEQTATDLREAILAIVERSREPLGSRSIEKRLPAELRNRCGANVINPSTGKAFPWRVDLKYHLNFLVTRGRLQRLGNGASSKYVVKRRRRGPTAG